MKYVMLIFVHFAGAAALFIGACSGGSGQSKLKGEWHSKQAKTTLKITNDKFTEDSGSPVTEDYFVKGDTIYTSFEGNMPYTKFAIKHVDDHSLTLLYPDSVLVSFIRL